MSDKTVVSCDQYDYFEIACMDHYHLEVETDQGSIVGQAKTLRASDGEEYLILETESAEEQVRLTEIVAITVLSETRRFDRKQFK